MFDGKLRPGQRLGRYPQQFEEWPEALESLARRGIGHVKYFLQRKKYTLEYINPKVNSHDAELKCLSEDELTTTIDQLRQNLYRYGLQEKLVARAFATIRETAFRVLGKRHYEVQILGGWVMLNGMVAEMETGQGKTLTATLPACTAALAGIPVHVVTANDYLAARDAELLQPLYERLGISVAAVVDGMETDARHAAYACNIVHSTSQQITFDYLRDRLNIEDDMGRLRLQYKLIKSEQLGQQSPLLLRGLCFTIIDEADSLLIDEAKTPLIISQTRESDLTDSIYFDALHLASSLEIKKDFNIDEKYNDVTLTQQGKNHLEQIAKSLDEIWRQKRRREIMVKQALSAEYLFQRDKHYLVKDDKVQIIDPLTGRAMPDRSWEQGLHQLIEAKENCEITGERDPLARISYQRFYKRYLRLSGMSGTVKEVAGELNAVYGLKVIKIPTHKPSRRKMLPEYIFKTADEKWHAFVNTVRLMNQQGRPLLIGTCTVVESEHVSSLLTRENISHQVLNARQDEEEADIISKAGERYGITVATNMAGRGTDIGLGDGVADIGGLHVLATSMNDARRIDRQLYGRCARQGDPGSCGAYLSLEDAGLVLFYPPAIIQLVSWLVSDDKPLPNWLGKMILRLPQKSQEYNDYKMRMQLIKQDRQQAQTLAFTGRME